MMMSLQMELTEGEEEAEGSHGEAEDGWDCAGLEEGGGVEDCSVAAEGDDEVDGRGCLACGCD